MPQPVLDVDAFVEAARLVACEEALQSVERGGFAPFDIDILAPTTRFNFTSREHFDSIVAAGWLDVDDSDVDRLIGVRWFRPAALGGGFPWNVIATWPAVWSLPVRTPGAELGDAA